MIQPLGSCTCVVVSGVTCEDDKVYLVHTPMAPQVTPHKISKGG